MEETEYKWRPKWTTYEEIKEALEERIAAQGKPNTDDYSMWAIELELFLKILALSLPEGLIINIEDPEYFIVATQDYIDGTDEQGYEWEDFLISIIDEIDYSIEENTWDSDKCKELYLLWKNNFWPG